MAKKAEGADELLPLTRRGSTDAGSGRPASATATAASRVEART